MDERERRDFRAFIAEQVEGLVATFPDFAFTLKLDGAKKAYIDWFESVANGDRSKVARIIAEAEEFTRVPSRIDLVSIEARLYPKPKAAVNPHCYVCGGSGWMIVVAGDKEGASRCPKGCSIPEVDPLKTTGSDLTPEEKADRIRRQSAFAAELAGDPAFAACRERKELEPVSADDIEAIKREQHARMEARKREQGALRKGMQNGTDEPGRA